MLLEGDPDQLTSGSDTGLREELLQGRFYRAFRDAQSIGNFLVRQPLEHSVDNPAIAGYDQEQFAKRLYYNRPIAGSLDAFRAARQTTAEILDRLSETEWLRQGTHTEHGRYTVLRWLELYAAHAHEHARQYPRRTRLSEPDVGQRNADLHIYMRMEIRR